VRVAVDVTPLLGPRTGIGKTVEGLLDALPAAAPDVEVVPWVLSARARGMAFLDGSRVLPLPASVALKLWGRFDLPAADRWLGDAEVVHGTNYTVPPMRRRPTTVTVNDCWAARHPDLVEPQVAALVAVVQRGVERGAWVHASTEWAAGEIREVYGAEKVAVVPFGIPDVGDVAPPPEGGPPFVLAIGRMEPRKGLDVLARAMDAVDPSVRLVLAGPDGGAAPERSARVELRGLVPEGERQRLLHSAAVLAYPSLEEGFGLPVLEAFAAGTPVVTTTAGALPEVAGDAALLVPPGDADALAEAITRVLSDDALRARLVAAGTARAAEFSWARHASGMVDLWRRAAAEEVSL
jgi:glycosyltransferase involved in cell wall biosynthesis